MFFQVIHPWNRFVSGIGDLVLVEGGLVRQLHRGWATSSTSRFMAVKFIWKFLYAVNFTFVEPTRLWESQDWKWSTSPGRVSLAVIFFSWVSRGWSSSSRGLCLVLFPTSWWGTPSPRHLTSLWTCSRMQWFRSCVIDFRNSGDWLNRYWMDIWSLIWK